MRGGGATAGRAICSGAKTGIDFCVGGTFNGGWWGRGGAGVKTWGGGEGE